jgi:hypothetical protein
MKNNESIVNLMKIKYLENLLYDIEYLFLKQWAWTVAIAIAAIAILSGKGAWLQSSAGVIEAITLFAVVFTAFNVLHRQRLDELDKKLTVSFQYENKIVLLCENAYLAGESDIRQWGQSIGQLMNNGERLDFEPFIRETSIIDKHNKKQYRHYKVVFTLNSLSKVSEETFKLYQMGKYIHWVCALESDSIQKTEGLHTPSVLT